MLDFSGPVTFPGNLAEFNVNSQPNVYINVFTAAAVSSSVSIVNLASNYLDLKGTWNINGATTGAK